MQAIAGLSRSISRALVQGVVQRSQSTEATQQHHDQDTKLGKTGRNFWTSFTIFFVLQFFY